MADPYLADYLPTEKITLTPNAVRVLVDALLDYSPEMDERELYYRLLRQLRQLAPYNKNEKD